MDNLTVKDLYELKESIAQALQKVEKQIMDFSVNGLDQDFDDLMKKAIYYRDLLQKIETQLSKY
jgi:hypothetical protein